MNIDQNLQTRLELTFEALKWVSASFPARAALASKLKNLAGPHEKKTPKSNYQEFVTSDISNCFTTAAVEMWQRAIHSFLISASLTQVSPIWASVAGYYSSHYAVRSIAHLLGYFQLFSYKRIVRLEWQGGKFSCSFEKKGGDGREHEYYWKKVNENSHFGSDALFVLNNSKSEEDASDAGHREISNYADHISIFPQFNPLDAQTVMDRVEHISQIPFSVPPIPRRSKFPDVDSVQIIAYQRLVRFRQFVDEIAGGSNRFWKVHRTPSWCRDYIDFQLIEQGGLGSSLIGAHIRAQL